MRSICSLGAKDKMRFVEEEFAEGSWAIPFSLTSLLEEGEELLYETRRHWATAIPYLLAGIFLARTISAFFLLILILPIFQIKTYDYAVTNKRILARQGLMRPRRTSVPLEAVEEMYAGESLPSAKLGMGCIVLKTEREIFRFEKIEDPRAFLFYANKARAACDAKPKPR
jgi:hypothetical protein